MSLKIVRNDITKMETEAIVNTANDNPTVGKCCEPIREDFKRRHKK